MIKMVILDQSKPISLTLKIKNGKFNNPEFVHMHWGGGWGIVGTVQIASWNCNFGIYLDIQVYYLDIQAITALL